MILLLRVDIPPKGMNIPILLVIILNNILPVILPIAQNNEILLYLQVRLPIFPPMFIQHIRQYIINKHDQ